jgi:hypothetical protein
MGFIVIWQMIAHNLTQLGTAASVHLYDTYSQTQALTLAESGAHAVIARLSHYGIWRGERTQVPFSGGTYTAGAVDDSTLGPFGVKVYSIGQSQDFRDTVEVRLIVTAMKPVEMPAGVTANTNVAANGGMTIDGRDHDVNGNVIPNSGTWAISTTTITELQANTWLGSTKNDIDHGLMRENDPAMDEANFVQTGIVWPDGFPVTPDLVMGGEPAGYPDGTLKKIAKSGLEGSQYVGSETNPPTGPNDLNWPLQGVTYVELGLGQSWLSVDFGSDSRGILVVHNATTTSEIKNLNSGTFRGLVIADDISHVHGDVIGAVIVLTDNPPSGNVVGNGGGSVMYSSKVIQIYTTALPGVKANMSIMGWYY